MADCDLTFEFWKGVAWGAAKHVLQSVGPAQMVRQVQRNLDVARMAVGHVSDGEWRLAGYAILELPFEGARSAAGIITAPVEAAIEIPVLIETAIKAADPEVKGAAAVQAVQDMAAIATAVAGAAEMAKGGGRGVGKSQFGTGKPPHSAEVTVTRNGKVISSEAINSGSMTPSEKALGFPRSSLAAHTEARAARSMALQPGDVMDIRGSYPPCPSCKGAMNKAAAESGATIRYHWGDSSWSTK